VIILLKLYICLFGKPCSKKSKPKKKEKKKKKVENPSMTEMDVLETIEIENQPQICVERNEPEFATASAALIASESSHHESPKIERKLSDITDIEHEYGWKENLTAN
jgi:t-SNARE complex subunit (syntaxin)